MKLISACLIGVKCAWDGKDKYQNKQAIQLLESSILIPVCPEQLGGLKTPRLPQEIQGGSGEDVLDGNCRIIKATETLKIARQLGIDEFIGKCNSPSCGFGQIYDGTFTGNLVPGNGVTTALLKRHGIKIITEKEL